MIAMAGIWAGENLTGGQAPIEVSPTSSHVHCVGSSLGRPYAHIDHVLCGTCQQTLQSWFQSLA